MLRCLFCFLQKENYDNIRKKYSSLSRQLSQEKEEKEHLEEKALDVQKLQSQVTEQGKIINNMKQVGAVSCLPCVLKNSWKK